jgi:hypothetical protein
MKIEKYAYMAMTDETPSQITITMLYGMTSLAKPKKPEP